MAHYQNLEIVTRKCQQKMMKVDFQTWITFKILWGNGTFAPLRVMDTLLKNEVRSNPDESLDLELLEMSIVSKKSLWKEPANQVEDSLLFIARIVSRYAQTTLCQTTVSCLKVKCLAVAFTRCVSHHRSYKSQNAFSNKKECCTTLQRVVEQWAVQLVSRSLLVVILNVILLQPINLDYVRKEVSVSWNRCTLYSDKFWLTLCPIIRWI
jgi:hypothetical protein